MDICQKQLNLYGNERDGFLDRIISGDETRIHHYKPESKRQSMEWKHPQSPIKKKFKIQQSTGKLILTVFLDVKSPVLQRYLKSGTTISSLCYSYMLIDKLKPAIRSKHQGLLSKGVVSLFDN